MPKYRVKKSSSWSRKRKTRRGKRRYKKKTGKGRDLFRNQKRTVRKMIKGDKETLYHHGAQYYDTILAAHDFENDVYLPLTNTANQDAFGNFTPRFVRGDLPSVPVIGSVNTGASLIDSHGGEIDGRQIRYMGTRFIFTMTGTDGGYIDPTVNYFRCMLCQIFSPDETETLDAPGWSKMWRHDCPPLTVSGNSTQQDILQSSKTYDNDLNKKRRLMKDTGWKKVVPKEGPVWSYDDPSGTTITLNWYLEPRKIVFFLKDGRKYRVDETGTIIDFKAINWAILSTWNTENAENIPNFSLRIDTSYKVCS